VDAAAHFCLWHKQPHHVDLTEKSSKRDKLIKGCRPAHEQLLGCGAGFAMPAAAAARSASASASRASDYRDELPVRLRGGGREGA